MATGNNEHCAYKFSAGLAQSFPIELEKVSEEKLNDLSMKKYEDLKYSPLIIKIVCLSFRV